MQGWEVQSARRIRISRTVPDFLYNSALQAYSLKSYPRKGRQKRIRSASARGAEGQKRCEESQSGTMRKHRKTQSVGKSPLHYPVRDRQEDVLSIKLSHSVAT